MNKSANWIGGALGLAGVLSAFFVSDEFLANTAHVTENAAFWIKTVAGVIGVVTIWYNGNQLSKPSVK